MYPDPTPLTDPAGYLALFKFNRRLRRCPRTGLSVTYADIGDPDGVPVLFVPPSGCSRWFAAPQDPLALGYGLRLIVVDRPGVGAVPLVPLKDRIDISCKLIVSVLEHLDVRPAYMVATSAGVYCALRLLSSHPAIFATGLSPPPKVYLISPWSPPLPSTDPLAYQQPLDWIPSALLTTQDITLPYVIPAVKTAEEAYASATKAVGGAVEAVKGWWGGMLGQKHDPEAAKAAAVVDALAAEETRREMNEKQDVAEDGIPVPDDVQTEVEQGGGAEEEPAPRRKLWGPSAKYLTMDYLYAEDFRGIGQEHMMCLNRGSNTGPDWFVRELELIADGVRAVTKMEAKKAPEKVEIEVWWGGLDGMVPKNGQEWLNKTLAAHPAEITFVAHFVPDGSHADLMLRAQGIGEVYTAIMMAGYPETAEEAGDAGNGAEAE